LSRDPKLSYVYFEWGRALQSQGKLDEAIEKYQKVTEKAPKFYLAYKFWADALKKQGKLNEAKKMYRKASEVDPTIHRK
jgi:tetratricopeptide (TPR) repeat protein